MDGKAREGFTTGSCATAAAKAAAFMLFSGKVLKHIEITVPRGDRYDAQLYDIMSTCNSVSCAVKKYSGSDPDVTDGCMVYVQVKADTDKANENGLHNPTIRITGGEGIGRVTRPGLDQPVGESAINSVPREMITKEVTEVCRAFDYHGVVDITVSVPGGEELAKKTFNPRLGIEGGISIIGTSGVVEPMSSKALMDTIRLELKQHRELGETKIAISPGNYGREFLKERYGFDIERAVKCSNYIGYALDTCIELGFTDVLIAGHIGKLVKLAAGIMNTHSHEADGRMEVLAAAGIRAGLPGECLINILDSVSTEEALGYIEENGRKSLELVMSTIIQRIDYYIDFRTGGRIAHKCVVFSDKYALVGSSPGTEELLDELRQNSG